jgi:hypothetical protein
LQLHDKDKDSDQDIQTAMQHMGATIDRFSHAVAKAKLEWAHNMQ